MDPEKAQCPYCGRVGFHESDGYYYCNSCMSQGEGFFLTGVTEDQFFDGDGTNTRIHTRRVQSQPRPFSPIPMEDPDAQDDYEQRTVKAESEEDELGPGKVPRRRRRPDDVRMRYLKGLQRIINLQCQALVEKFHVTPLIVGISSTLWFRFLVSTGVLKSSSAEDASRESNSQDPEIEDCKRLRSGNKYKIDSSLARRKANVWLRSLRRRVPLSCTLTVSYLACHVAREAVLPTDIVNWSVEGKLPYFAAHVEVDKVFNFPSSACPLSSSQMFRPSVVPNSQTLESTAATVAESIGMLLPPVNFYAICSRYVKQLSLPIEKILNCALHIFEWSMPPDLYISTNVSKLPPHLCIMSILIVAIRVLYKIHGFGVWEESLHSTKDSGMKSRIYVSTPFKGHNSGEESDRTAPPAQKSALDTAGLLQHLEATCYEIHNTHGYKKDLPLYLEHCKDMVFGGAGSSATYESVEENLIKKLWNQYENTKCSKLEEEECKMQSFNVDKKRSRKDDGCATTVSDWPSPCTGYKHANLSPNDHFSHRSTGDDEISGHHASSAETLKDKAIRRLKLDMEQHRFHYIPPRVNVKTFDYLHYVRKNDDHTYTYAAHADYYILLRACARVAEVDIRVMHIAVLIFEKRLAWLEGKTDRCLHIEPQCITCEFCTEAPDLSNDDIAGFSMLNL